MVSEWIEQFRQAAESGPFGYEYAHHEAGQGEHPMHRVVGCMIHGNEYGSLPAALRLVHALKTGEVRARGPLTVLLGNTAAALANQRFLEEDFNRVFTFDRPAVSHERKLAERVRPILDSADYFLDLHQTQTPTSSPFWTFPWSSELGLLARALDLAPVGLTRPSGQVFSAGTCCLDEYVRNRGRVGLTAELGLRGADEAQAAAAYRGMLRFLDVSDRVAAGGLGALTELAQASPEVSWYRTADVYKPVSTEYRLRPGLENWQPVQEGEKLSADESPTIRASLAGRILFPKYPSLGAPPAPELFRLAAPFIEPNDFE